MPLTIEMEENEVSQKMDLPGRMRSLGGRVSIKADGLKKWFSRASSSFFETLSWKFCLGIGVLVLVLGLVFGLWADLKTHLQIVHRNTTLESQKLSTVLTDVSKQIRDAHSYRPENCYRLLNCGYRDSGFYSIDPPGVEPFNVYCHFDKIIDVHVQTEYPIVTTRVPLANKTTFLLEDNTGKSMFKTEFVYANATIKQLAALVYSSEMCRQTIKFDCRMMKMKPHGTWFGRNNQAKNYLYVRPNCPKEDSTWKQDIGIVDDMNVLPIRGFEYKSLDFSNGLTNGTITIGPLECFGTREEQGWLDKPCLFD